MNVDYYSCEVSQDEDLFHPQYVKFVFGDSPKSSNDEQLVPAHNAVSEKEISNGSTSSETKTSWDEVMLGEYIVKEETWADLTGMDHQWQLIPANDVTNAAWDNALIESLKGELTPKHESAQHSNSSDCQPSGLSDLECTASTTYSLSDLPLVSDTAPQSKTTLSNDSSGHDDEFVELYHTEMEFQELMASATDPIGKFLKTVNLTAQEAVQLNVQDKLLTAPKTPRKKYGKRKVVSKEERYLIQKERNKMHARATRSRRKIFKEVLKVQQEAASRSSQSEEHLSVSSICPTLYSPHKG